MMAPLISILQMCYYIQIVKSKQAEKQIVLNIVL